MLSVAELIMGLLSDYPTLFTDAESLVGSIVHGEGGLRKAAAVSANLATLAGHVANAVGSHPAAQPVETPTPTPAALTAGDPAPVA